MYKRFRRSNATILRLTALAAKFVFVFVLARFLDIGDIGVYGLLTATMSYVIYVIGFDFYTYSNRDVIRSDRSAWGKKIRSHAAFATMMYAIVLPASIALFWLGFLPWSMGGWFLALVILEHLGMEIDRVLIAMRNHVAASVTLFIRQAGAPIFVLPAMVFFEGMRTLNHALGAIVFFDLIALIVGLLYLRRELGSTSFGGTDWSWIRRGVRVSLVLFISTLCLRALFMIDRQIVNLFGSAEQLGAYTLYVSIGAGLSTVIGASVHQFMYPRLVSAAHARDRLSFRRSAIELLVQTIVLIGGFSIPIVLALPWLLDIISQPAYKDASWMLPWILLAVGIYNLGLVPHFVLYAMDADKIILFTTIISTCAFMIVAAATLHLGAVVAVLIALFGASVMMLCLKGAFAYALFRKI